MVAVVGPGARRRLRLKSVNAQSVRAYQVIELPRAPRDPPEGTLHLALGPDTHGSWWDHAATYLGTYRRNAPDRADQRGDNAPDGPGRKSSSDRVMPTHQASHEAYVPARTIPEGQPW